MQESISKSECKAKALELFREVEPTGESVIVTDRGRPTIEVRRFSEKSRGPLELLAGSVSDYLDPFAAVGDDEWDALLNSSCSEC